MEECEVVATSEDVNDPNRYFEMPRNASGGINVFSVHVEPECLHSSSVVLLVDLVICVRIYTGCSSTTSKNASALKTCDVINPASDTTVGCRFQYPCEQQNGCNIGFFYGSPKTALIRGLKICSVKVAP